MRRGFFSILLTLLVLSSSLPAAARPFDLPPGKWWENQRLVAHIQLSPEQQEAIRELVYEHARRMVDLNANVEKSKLALENEVDQEDFVPERVRKAFTTFQNTRRELELERFEMLLSVRQLLTAEQWDKLIGVRDRLQQMRQRRDRPGLQARPDRRPSGGDGL